MDARGLRRYFHTPTAATWSVTVGTTRSGCHARRTSTACTMAVAVGLRHYRVSSTQRSARATKESAAAARSLRLLNPRGSAASSIPAATSHRSARRAAEMRAAARCAAGTGRRWYIAGSAGRPYACSTSSVNAGEAKRMTKESAARPYAHVQPPSVHVHRGLHPGSPGGLVGREEVEPFGRHLPVVDAPLDSGERDAGRADGEASLPSAATKSMSQTETSSVGPGESVSGSRTNAKVWSHSKKAPIWFRRERRSTWDSARVLSLSDLVSSTWEIKASTQGN